MYWHYIFHVTIWKVNNAIITDTSNPLSKTENTIFCLDFKVDPDMVHVKVQNGRYRHCVQQKLEQRLLQMQKNSK